jgi:prepilin peptidase CpaA
MVPVVRTSRLKQDDEMFDWTLQHIVFIAAVTLFTATAAYTDIRFWKIPNKLTFPFFLLGWVYQCAFWGWPGLLDGLGGFAVGFGTYFVLFAIAGGGGGDVKLMGALSVWLGFNLTILMMILSTLLVILDVGIVSLYKVLRYGAKYWKKQHLATGKTDARGKAVHVTESFDQKQKRRILPFAIPVAMATWLLMVLGGTGVIKNKQLAPRAVPQQQAQVER